MALYKEVKQKPPDIDMDMDLVHNKFNDVLLFGQGNTYNLIMSRIEVVAQNSLFLNNIKMMKDLYCTEFEINDDVSCPCNAKFEIKKPCLNLPPFLIFCDAHNLISAKVIVVWSEILENEGTNWKIISSKF